MIEKGILKKVATSKWATPIVPIKKPNGKIRVCGDYKITLNPCLMVDEYPLPTVDQLFANMAGGKLFTKIDLQQAYLQLEVTEEHQEYLTLNTPLGLLRPTRLLFGVASAPAIWQRTIEQILQGIPGISVFLDDIRITGTSDEQHLERLEMVLSRFEQFNIKINVDKSTFMSKEIEYCGYVIDSEGIHKAKSKIDAIQKLDKPKNKDQLRSYLGMINYYGRFFKDLSTTLCPLYNLLKKNSPWQWDKSCDKAFDKVKQEMLSSQLLCHFDPKLPLILACDASPYGVGAVLSHKFPDGSERPIQFASQTLNETQRRYSQIDREAYSIVWGIKKFYQYLFGTKFTLISDNKPITQIFSPKKGLPVLSTTRMQHYAIFLQNFNFDLIYRNTKQHANVDAFSRLPAPEMDQEELDEADLLEIATIENLPVTVNELKRATSMDETLIELLQALETGNNIQNSKRFHVQQQEFTLQQSCIFRGQRVLIPTTLRKRVLDELHSGHVGVIKMKSLARSYCWWPGIDRDLENLALNCYHCKKVMNNPPPRPHIWQPPETPFERVHIDYAGPFLGKHFLIVVDAYSKWPEVVVVNNIATRTTINACRSIFARYGLPNYIVTDNGPSFTAKEFQQFLKSNGIHHKLSAPYHPATNGQAERFVQTFKKALKAMNATTQNVHQKLDSFLLSYRRAPHITTGKSPSELLFNRRIRSLLDVMKPSAKQEESKTSMDLRPITLGQRVAARNYNGNDKWKFGKIVEKLGSAHYTVELDDGRKWKRHVDQIREVGPQVRDG